MTVRQTQRLMRMHRALRKQRATRKANPLRALWFNARKVYFLRWLENQWGGFIDLNATIGDVTFLHGPFGVFIGTGCVIGDGTKIGQHVTIGVSISADYRPLHSPQIGRDVFIGANATIIGRCNIGDGAKIGAGVVLVDADVPAGATIVNMSAYDITNGRWAHPRNPLT